MGLSKRFGKTIRMKSVGILVQWITGDLRLASEVEQNRRILEADKSELATLLKSHRDVQSNNQQLNDNNQIINLLQEQQKHFRQMDQRMIRVEEYVL